MINMEALDEVMAIIEREVAENGGDSNSRKAGRWNQLVYGEMTECGTALCVAGWRAHLDGELVFSPIGLTAQGVIIDGKEFGIDTYARQAFGLTHNDAKMLFYHHNTLADLRKMVAELGEFGTLRLIGERWAE